MVVVCFSQVYYYIGAQVIVVGFIIMWIVLFIFHGRFWNECIEVHWKANIQNMRDGHVSMYDGLGTHLKTLCVHVCMCVWRVAVGGINKLHQINPRKKPKTKHMMICIDICI